jgi:5-methylcytosine-specific restriction endonuclease McrA
MTVCKDPRTSIMEVEDLTQKYINDVIFEATGGNGRYGEDIGDDHNTTRDELIAILEETNVYFSFALRSDIDRVFDGDEPQYFVPQDRFVQLYEENHGFEFAFGDDDESIDQTNEDPPLRHIGEGIDNFLKNLHDRKYWLLVPYRKGAACRREQAFFYETDEWKNRREVVRTLDRLTCQRCGCRGYEAHHDEHIYSVFSGKFYRNFDVHRLRCLCKKCHATFHQSHVRGPSHFVEGSAADLKRRGQHRAALEELHDSLRECRFCFPRETAGGTQQFFGNN